MLGEPMGAGHVTSAVLGHGIYSLAEAARLLEVRTGKIDEWFRGRRSRLSAVLTSVYGEAPRVGFLDLLEALVVTRLRERGFSLLAVRKAHVALGKELHTSHPFSHKGLYTDGETVFVHIAKK